LKYDDQGNTDMTNPGQEPDWNTTYSWGRRQPYDAVIKYPPPLPWPPVNDSYMQQPQGVAMGKINYTLGQHNGQTAMGQTQWPQQGDKTLELPFRPLAHFDRVLLSPTELFQVVGTKPHELTHEFCGPPPAIDPNNGLTLNGRLKYLVNWVDQPQVPT